MSDQNVRVVLEAVVGQFSRSMQTARRDAQGLMTSVEANSAALTKLGLGMTATGALLVKGLVNAGRESTEFSSKITKLTTQVGIARDEAREMGQAMLGLSSAGKGPQELGDALFFVTSAGFRGAEALDVVSAAARASSIGLGETATVADLVTSAVNAYGSEALNASQATDVLIGAVREGKAEAPALAGALGRILPIASEMGVRFDEVGAAVAAMTRTGSDAATATTQLRAMLVTLLNPANDSADALAEVGLSADGLRRTIREDGLWAALMQIRDALGDNQEALARVFPNVRALAGFLDLTGASAETTGEIFGRMSDTTGLLAEGFATWATTTEAAQQRFSAAMEAVRVSLGQDVEGPMASALDTGTGLALMFSDLDDSTRSALVGLVGVTGGIATLGGTSLLTLVALAQVKKSLEALSLSSGSLIRLLTNPYVLAVGAAAAALGFWVKAKADARARIEQLTDAVRADSGAIEDNTRAYIENRLEQEGALSAGLRLGVSRETMVRAAAGETDALDRVNAALSRGRRLAEEHNGTSEAGIYIRSEQARAVGEVEKAFGRLLPEIEKVIEAEEANAQATREEYTAARNLAMLYGGEYVDALGEASGATGDLTGDVDALADEMGELGEETLTAVEAMDEFQSALKAQTDPVIRVSRALNGLETAQDKVTEARKKHGRGSPEHRRALLDEVAASQELRGALGNLTASMDDGVTSRDKLEEQMRFLTNELGLSEDAARELLSAFGDYNDMAGNLREAELRVNAAEGKRALRDFERDLAQATRARNVSISASWSIGAPPVPRGGQFQWFHDGGVVRRYHDGGQVGHDGASMFDRLAPDEVPAILQTRERVLSRDQNDAFERLMRTLGTTVPAGAAARSGGGGPAPAGGSGGYQPIQIAVDGRVLAEVLYDPLSGEVVRNGRLTGGAG